MNKYTYLPLVVTGMAFSAHVYAEMVWQPRVTLSQSLYDFDLKNDYTNDSGRDLDNAIKISVDYTMLGLGLSALFEDFYIDGVVQKNISGETGNFYEERTSIPAPNVIPRESADFDRLDLSLTVGTEICENLSVYAGYRHGKTKFTGGFDGIFETKGPFAGATYAIPINDNSVIAIGGSFAQLDGGWQDPDGFKYSSDKTGFSYNLSYHHNISQTTGFYLRYSAQSYAYSFYDPGNTPRGPVEITLDEKIRVTELGIYMRF